MKHAWMNLDAIADSHSVEIESLLSGMHGARPLWTASMRAAVRKDDPPEEDDISR